MRSKPATAWRAKSRIRWASAAALLASLAGLALPALARSGVRGADGEFETRTSAHFVLYQDVDIDESGGFRGSRRFEQGVLEELEHAYGDLDAFLALRPPRRLEVLVYDPGVFDANFGGLFRFPAAGFYGGVIRVRGDSQLTERLARTLHHELVHAAFDAVAPSLVLPAWFNEGIAEWFEARTLSKRRLSSGELGYLVQASQQGALLPLDALSTPSFSRLEVHAATTAYLQSYGMIEYLARHYGDRALRDFCAEVVRSRDLDRALRRAFRIDLLDLEAGFVSELN
jgi:hypothetical protein